MFRLRDKRVDVLLNLVRMRPIILPEITPICLELLCKNNVLQLIVYS